MEGRNFYKQKYINLNLKINSPEYFISYSYSYLGYRTGASFIETNWYSKWKRQDLI